MDRVIDLIKEKPVVIPRILFNNYKSLNITDEELIVIMVIMDFGEKVSYNPEEFARVINTSRQNIMKVISNLCNKGILTIDMEKRNNKSSEYVSLDLLYEKLFNTFNGEIEKEIDTSIFTIFENELGRTMSPMEYEKIKEWITSGNSEELIACALKEAVMNGVNNFNYIDRILDSWKKKGYKNKKDVVNDKEKYHSKKEKVELYDTDWLNE